MQEYAYINAELLPIEKAKILITDLAILRGYGVFDFFRAIEGKPIYMEDHLDRFENSVKRMNMEIPYSRDHIRENILDLINMNPYPLLGIKLLCTGGYSEDGYTPTRPNLMMLAKPFKMQPLDKEIKLMTVKHIRELADIKTINYITPISVIPQLKATNSDDVLYHFGGQISESSRANIFIVKGDKIITPKANILRGITRMQILNLAKNNFEIEVRKVKLKEVFEADEAFLSGSTRRVTFVKHIDNHTFNTRKVTDKINTLLMQNERDV
jgi:branched-chain amino acid aminotransferase